MSFATIDLFARVVTAFPAGFAALDRLAVDHPCARLAVTFVEQTDVLPQVSMNLFDQTRIGPATEVAVSALPRRQILWQVAPLAAGAQEVEDGVEQFALTVLAPTTGGRGLGETI